MPMRIVMSAKIDTTASFVSPRATNGLSFSLRFHSSFPSTRINLSPFTKVFRGGCVKDTAKLHSEEFS